MTRRAAVIELVGVAGAGKTTLFQQIAVRNGFFCLPGVWQLPAWVLASSAVRTLPSSLDLWRRARMIPWEETKHVIRLDGLFRLVGQHSDRTVLLDEGPVFALAWLRGRGRAAASPEQFVSWWRPTLARWREQLDAIILLEAPIPVLAQRVRSRKKWHAFQDRDDGELHRFLEQSSDALMATIADLTSGGGQAPEVVRIRTDGHEPTLIADELERRLNGRLHGR